MAVCDEDGACNLALSKQTLESLLLLEEDMIISVRLTYIPDPFAATRRETLQLPVGVFLFRTAG